MRTDPKTGRKYEATSRKGKEIWQAMKKKKERAKKREANKKAKAKCTNGKCSARTVTASKMHKLSPLKGVKNGGVRLSASWYYNTACGGKISRCEPQMILQSNGDYVLKKIRIVNGQSGPEPRWVKV